MAWTIGNTIAVNNEKISDNSLQAQALEVVSVGDVLIVGIASDNTSTTFADNSEVLSVTDPRGNTYTKAREVNNAAAAGASCTISLWYSQITTAIQINDLFTVTWVSSRTAKSFSVQKFTMAAGSTVSIQAGISSQVDGGAPGSLDLTTPNAEFLWVRAFAHEAPNTDLPFTKTAAYSTLIYSDGTSGGGAASNMCIGGEADVFTGTTNPSNPTIANADHASVLVAFKENAAGSTPSNAGRGWINSKGGWF